MASCPRATFQYTDTFTTVQRRGRKNDHRNRPHPPLSHTIKRVSEELASQDAQWLTQSLQLVRNGLDALSERFSPDIVPEYSVLCLGLGSPTLSPISRVQLAFLLKICETFDVKHTSVTIDDPAFTADDMALFSELEFRILTDKNPDGAIMTPTIVYMLHCDARLYENVLCTNWSKDRLPKALFIANRLCDYVDSYTLGKLESEFPCLLRMVPHLDSFSLPLSHRYPTAFNNSSVQFVRTASIDEI